MILGSEVRAALGVDWPLIPAVDSGGSKHPIRKWKGVTGAVYDNVRAELWAVPTGAVTGVVVLDFDGTSGERARWRLFGNDTPHTRTGSGGTHVYVTHPGWPVRTMAATHSGVDVRGDGGIAYVAGRSRFGGYKVLRPLTDPLPWDALPLEAQRMVRPRTERQGAPAKEYSGTGTGRIGALNYLDRQVEAVRNAEPGSWNSTYSRAVYAVAGLVAAGDLAADHAWRTLDWAAGGTEEAVLKASWAAGTAAPWSVSPTVLG